MCSIFPLGSISPALPCTPEGDSVDRAVHAPLLTGLRWVQQSEALRGPWRAADRGLRMVLPAPSQLPSSTTAAFVLNASSAAPSPHPLSPSTSRTASILSTPWKPQHPLFILSLNPALNSVYISVMQVSSCELSWGEFCLFKKLMAKWSGKVQSVQIPFSFSMYKLTGQLCFEES